MPFPNSLHPKGTALAAPDAVIDRFLRQRGCSTCITRRDRSGRLVQVACDIVQQTSLVLSFLFVNDVTNVQSFWDFGDARMLLNSPMYLVLLNANIGVHIYIYNYICRHIYIYTVSIYILFRKTYLQYRYLHIPYDSHIYIMKNTYILFMISYLYICFIHAKIFQNTIYRTPSFSSFAHVYHAFPLRPQS